MSVHPLDICRCGDNREDHEGGIGRCREYHLPPGCRCRSFRLAATAADIAEGYAEWIRLQEAEGR